MVLVSHESEMIKNFCGREWLLDQGVLRSVGKPEDVLRDYHELLGMEHR